MSNDNIELLRSNPKHSLMRLAIPIMITMITTSLYNIIDGIWVAGLGTISIAGVGLFTPLWMLINGLASGLSNGSTSAIARFREESDQKANIAGEQSIIVFFLGSVILSVSLALLLIPFLNLFTASPEVYKEAIDYAIPLIVGLITFVFSMGLSGILRAEGDTKRSMYAMTLGVILNATLDPVFIYILNMGVAGAAVSTIVTSFISSIIIIYWIFIKKNTYIKIDTSIIFKLKINWPITKDILSTGIPSSMVLFMLSFAAFVFYYFLNIVGGDLGVSIYSSGNRIYLLGLMPITSICSALVAIVATHYGAHNIDYVKKSHNYSCLYSVIIGTIIAILFIVFSDQISYVFLLTNDDPALLQGISTFIKYTALCIPFLGVGLPSTYLYQGLGKGLQSLFCTTFTEVICTIPATYVFAFNFNCGVIGIWLGFIVGRGFSSILNFLFTRYTIRILEKNRG
ncbi:MATE family efflux transporter [uncultured Methanobrevibacter sp.]|uniref:MATE family efflux transporter n=1 Tax=uncultured Methanobrevibacter sp. TaxID=253161 RepID=UPI0025FC7EE4|nr:MATE family efflux transporter [uncultured Methanobrevibacter sp.]